MIQQAALANPLSLMLDKDRKDFTRADMLKVIRERNIERLSFHYTSVDGKLRELKLPFSDFVQAERILASGERVDGSSLFHGLVDAAASDLYVVPEYRTAFLSPFDGASLNFICRFLDRDGSLAAFTPDNILAISHQRFKQETGLELHALGELEFFLLREGGPENFSAHRQVGYHASSPFFKGGDVVNQMVRHLTQITGAVKYAHAEVGYIDSVRSNLPLLKGRRAEQHEIELLTRPIEEMGDLVGLARWIIRNVAHRNGMLATFAPKIEEGVAGNGLHFHLELVRDGHNIMSNEDGTLSEDARKLIGGLVDYASTLSAFGNTVASSFLRLVPNQEAPTRICWSHNNRSALIRVPLGWSKESHLAKVVNPADDQGYVDPRGRQTVEIRSPDGSASFHLLLAGITTAAEHGLTSDGMLEVAERTNVEGNVFEDKSVMESLEPLPASCVQCARLLDERRDMYEKDGVFPKRVIDHQIELLTREDDEKLNHDFSHLPAEERLVATRELMHKDIHRH
ncbi:MAG: glutamine synthetase family protein [Thermoanaerobaculales bacterium]|jgi:glutamine synthetase|nr:glutamine synthetase family protein [Thermoanaerobaculales bacterium]